MVENIEQIEIELNLGGKSKLSAMKSGDYTTGGDYNENLAIIKSETVKDIVDLYINDGADGFSINKTKEYISRMPKEEISEDIAIMYKYLVGANE